MTSFTYSAQVPAHTRVDAAAHLRERANAAQASGPRRRTRELALHLGVSECELVHAQYDGLTAQPLAGAMDEMFAALTTLGRVMALTRNDWCVHERHGVYQGHVQQGPVHLMLGPDIDLRAFVNRWRYAYAVEQDGRRSLQFFDASGLAVHKVYCTEASDAQAYQAYLARFAARWDEADIHEADIRANRLPAVSAQSAAPKPAVPDACAPDTLHALRPAWLALQDTHDFAPMLHRLGITRLQALRGAGADLAQEVAPDSVERLLAGAAHSGLPIMCFVSNPGMVQIHTGPIHTLRRTGDWYNVLDAQFSLHLNTAAVAHSWVVNKPTVDGWVRSLELYHESGEMVVQFFGRRKEGQQELADWRALLDTLCAEPLMA